MRHNIRGVPENDYEHEQYSAHVNPKYARLDPAIASQLHSHRYR